MNYSIYNIIKVYALQWSPMSTHLSTWEQYSQTAGQEPRPNLHVWNTGSGKKKHLAGMYIFLQNHPPPPPEVGKINDFQVKMNKFLG